MDTFNDDDQDQNPDERNFPANKIGPAKKAQKKRGTRIKREAE